MSNQEPNAPMPRMTDSQAGPGGPSSLKFAALSVQSYHLDSPPFTGTAVGAGGPTLDGGAHPHHHHPREADEDQASTDEPSLLSSPTKTTPSTTTNNPRPPSSPLARHSVLPNPSTSRDPSPTTHLDNVPETHASSSSSSSSTSPPTRCRTKSFQPSHEPSSPSSSYPLRTSPPPPTSSSNPTRGSNRSRTTSRDVDQNEQQRDVDVPNWDLDGKPYTRENSSASVETLKLSGGRVVGMTTTSKIQDEPQSVGSFNNPTTTPRSISNRRERRRTGEEVVSESRSSRTNGEEETQGGGGGGGGGGGFDDGRRRRAWPTKEETRRPAYTQFSEDVDGLEDASSSSGAAEKDEEVDGDETGYVLRPSSNTRDGKVPVQGQTKEEYTFPKHRLPTKMRDETKVPLVIVACGSFSPPTYLHLRIFEMAKDQIIESGKYELLGGYYSPVSDYYKKEGLAKATHRVRMCELAVEKTSTWLMVDAWESLQDEYQRTAVVLDHFDDEINSNGDGGVLLSDGTRRRIKIMLLAGGDLIQSMGEPGVWANKDLHHILGKYGCLIVERTGADVWSFLLSHDLLWKYRGNLKIVKQTIYNDISSSKVRLFVRRGQSIKYLLPNSVIHYIEKHGLYRLPDEEAMAPPDDSNW